MAVAPAHQPRVAQTANIGQSLFIKGEVSGSEDLTVDGRIEGRIDLKDHNLTIGPNGRVHAEVHAKNITIVGEVTGNVVADEKVDLTDSARLVGDIRAPRIAISDGAQLKGSIDMVQHQSDKQEKSQAGMGLKERSAPQTQAQPMQQMAQTAQVGKGMQ
ncbi:MAG TPA: polymer-forming cytoskeletal protein [Candidatus Polarisedimenticolia bacterium]|nr:polymer-forming cytoskeletal protein [Candidatus Polarisedimenticolia bacterium]